jgi:hypothetical protein
MYAKLILMKKELKSVLLGVGLAVVVVLLGAYSYLCLSEAEALSSDTAMMQARINEAEAELKAELARERAAELESARIEALRFLAEQEAMLQAAVMSAEPEEEDLEMQ